MSTFEGGNGQIQFDGTTVTITREGGMGGFSKMPTVTIPIGEVVDVLVHEPAVIMKGWVYIATAGNEQMPSATEVGKNPNTVTLNKKQLQALAPVRAEILTAIGKA